MAAPEGTGSKTAVLTEDFAGVSFKCASAPSPPRPPGGDKLSVGINVVDVPHYPAVADHVVVVRADAGERDGHSCGQSSGAKCPCCSASARRIAASVSARSSGGSIAAQGRIAART